MNTVELLAVIKNCFENTNPKVLIPKTFTKQKNAVLEAALKDVSINQSSETLMNLTKVWVRILSSGDDKAYNKCISALAKVDNLPLALKRRLQKKTGEGQLRFTVESPAGPARLCRVPFYPIRNENAWSTRYTDIDSASPSRQAFGIDTLGDDPIISIGPWLGNQNSNKISSIQLSTQKVEFGSYRLVGMEINAYYGSRYIGAIKPAESATGSLEVVGTSTAAIGTITNVGPAAVTATADFEFVGAGTPAVGTVNFNTAPVVASGSISGTGNNGTVASVDFDPSGGSNSASGSLGLNFTPTAPGGGGTTTNAINSRLVCPNNGSSVTFSYTLNANLLAGHVLAFRFYSYNPVNNTGGLLTSTITAGNEFAVGATPNDTLNNLKTYLETSTAPIFGDPTASAVVNGTTITITLAKEFSAEELNGLIPPIDQGAAANPPNYTSTAMTGGADAGPSNANAYITFQDARGNFYYYYVASSPDAAPPIGGATRIRSGSDHRSFASGLATLLISEPEFTVTSIINQPAASTIDTDQVSTGSGGNTDITITPSGSANGITTVSFSQGTDVIPENTTVTVTDTLGNQTVMTATLGVPVGTQFQVFTTYEDQRYRDSFDNLIAEINAQTNTTAAAAVYNVNAPNVTGTSAITQDIGGIGGNVGPASTNPNLNITTFANGTSSFTDGDTITLINTDGVSTTFTGRNNPTTGLHFLTSADVEYAILTGANALAQKVGAFNFLITQAGPDYVITQTVAGSLGNTVVSGTKASGNWNFAGGGTPNDGVFVNGTDAVIIGQDVELIDSQLGGSQTTVNFQAVANNTPNPLPINAFRTTGVLTETLTNLETAINNHPFNITANYNNVNTISLTQGLAGTQGNTTITVTNGATLTGVSFTNGADAFPINGDITVTDNSLTAIDTVIFQATANTTNANSFAVQGLTQSQIATNFNQAVGLAAANGLEVSSVVDGNPNQVNITQDVVGTDGENGTPASIEAEVLISAFSGASDAMADNTSITVQNASAASVTLVTPADFSNTGTASQIASNFAIAVNGAGLNLNAVANGTTVSITQSQTGTVGNNRTASTTSAQVNAPAGNVFSGGVDNVTAGTTITLEDADQVPPVTATFVAGVDFAIDNLVPSQTIDNLRDAINNSPINISALSNGLVVNLTQGTAGPIGNTPILSSNDTELDPNGFGGGTYSVELGSRITLIATDGTTEIFEAIDIPQPQPPDAIGYDVEPTTLATLNNLKTAIDGSALAGKITAVVADPFINLTQVIGGVAGDTTITVTNDFLPPTLIPTGFAGGVDASLNLANPFSPVAITVKDLTVYNGNNILIVEDSEAVSASEFNILNKSEQLSFEYDFNFSSFDPNGQTAQPLSNDNEDSSYKFIGFRDQPIVDPNSQVFVKLDAFIANLPQYIGAYPANTPLPKIPPVSLSINLVVDLLEDKVFGDIAAPSPASRAAANIKLSGREVGEGRIIVDNSTTKKPRI